jgi:hypothetical protein
MAFRTAAEAIIGRDGCNGCGSTLGTAILSDDEYEYETEHEQNDAPKPSVDRVDLR